MKKSMAVILAAVLAASTLAGCGGSQSSAPATTAAPAAADATQAAPDTQAAAQETTKAAS